jgi:glycosyltransferase involved in cell wall biosynthesis
MIKFLKPNKAVDLSSFKMELGDILERWADVEHKFIFPPSLDWYKQIFQRPQQLAQALARRGALVFYVQLEYRESAQRFQNIEDRLYICNVPVNVFKKLEDTTIYTLTWNAKLGRGFDNSQILYDYVDEIETFQGFQFRLRRFHHKLLRKADLVTATSQQLLEQVLPTRPDAILCPNGVDYELFAYPGKAAKVSVPEDLTEIVSLGKPIVGYQGAIARWFDYDLMRELALSRQDLSFVLIGPDFDGTLVASGLQDLGNLHWLGEKKYEKIPSYLQKFDVAMIPFLVNSITHATSPIKLFEYMAAGKPVVVTPMRESKRYPGVLVAGDPAEFSENIDRALHLKDDPEYLEILERTARENTWSKRAAQILEALERN